VKSVIEEAKRSMIEPRELIAAKNTSHLSRRHSEQGHAKAVVAEHLDLPPSAVRPRIRLSNNSMISRCAARPGAKL
jgi:hypothetical protein